MSQNTNTPLMPPRGHSTAPSFDPSEVRSLRRYFQDLEALFTRCQITDEAAKKQWAVRYPSIDVADLWETIESFIDVAKSYNDWKADVRALYPGTDDTRKWSLADMDQLIGERARIGIHNAADLGCYYRDFMAITKHLIAQHRLSPIEQSRAFLRGFQPALLTRLETRLHLKHPDHYTDDPYTMAEIHAAATFILHGTSSTPTTAANQATASTSSTSTTVPPGMIKTEDISMIIESLSRTIATLIQLTTHATHNHAPAPRQQAAIHVHENSGAEQTCHYCGNRGCRVGTCKFAEIDIRDGKCKRNTEGKIVLPNGSFCPRTIPGLTIRDRIYEWHRRNLAAPAAPTMLFEIDDRSTMQTFTLNTSSRIEVLERELLQLRKRREVFDGVEILQRKKPTTPVVTRSAEASGAGTSKGVAAPSSTSTSTAPPPTIPAASPAPPSPPTQSTSHPIITSAPPAPPVHPFANARDATYAPPNVRNFATPPKPSNDKGKEPAYKTIVPVIQPKLAEEIFQCSMKSPFVTLTPEELLSIAPDVRNKYRDAVTPKRVSTEPVVSAHIVEIGADEVTAVNQLSCSGATLEPGATIVPDPYETYLKHIPHGEHPAEFTVARDSNAIRSIIALVDNKEQIECIVDPAYDILLGRPFDVLTQSVVKNFADENQTITILCPNTGETVTIPTTPTTAANQATASTSSTSTTVPPGMIKTEDISMIIESLSRTIATLIQLTTHATHNHAPAPRQQAAIHVHENSGAEQTCHYCGNRGCRVGTCKFAEIDIRDGKCKRNTEGKIVLPNGSFCPRTIPGLTIRDRIYEWHRRNLAAPAAPTMLFEIDDRSTMQTFTLNTSSRIEVLERELLQLRKRREVFDGVEILQRKKPTTPVVTRSAEASGAGTSKGVAAPSSTSTSTAPPPTIPAASPAPPSPPTQSTSHPIITSAPPAPPVHPFANARDATYAPPNVRNFATPPKPSNDKGKEPAYKTIVPVIQPKLAEEIFQCSMKSPFVTLTPEELLSIAPDVRNKYRDAVTPKRVSTEPVVSAHIVEIGADEVTAVNQLSCSGATLEPGATIVPDPYETYLKHIPHGEHPAEFTVARDSNAIRSIIALVDNKEQIECIVDPGSQIVAMSE
ncbi:predicted protein [Postia placenta Mad-698-R]|nr:predicted protein [Postia placenta Mad-698-R]